ncbi:NADP-dependent oxidoreductase domain-containing protein [Flagelloscypha sp. PMI_526]|nr:NADP-dependent oxidoreductase domain-containing protein [Flagelloscypha sp. PMI_526]
MIQNVVNLGGAAKDIRVAPVGHGLMFMTIYEPVRPDDVCFEAIKTGIDQLPNGVKMVLNSAEFYGVGLSTLNLEMLSRFFEKYPDYKDKAFLSVKGCLVRETMSVDCSEKNIRRSVDSCIEALRGQKKIDLFECGRVDPKVPIEDSMKTMLTLIEEGKFDYIGLSECSAATLRRAAAVAPVVSAEIECSLWAYEEETKKVIDAAKELGISIHAYSPLGQGWLTGKIKSVDSLASNDYRRKTTKATKVRCPNYHTVFDDNLAQHLEHNLQIVPIVEQYAEAHNCTPAQLALAWVHSLGSHVLPLPSSSTKERVMENLYAGDIKLSDEESKQLLSKVDALGIKGGRGVEGHTALLWG